MKKSSLTNSAKTVAWTDMDAPKRPCCQTGCPDCPHGYTPPGGPEIPSELKDPWQDDEGENIYQGEIPEAEELPCQREKDA